MTNSLIYIFDPLCGWCYGSLPRLIELAEEQSVTMLPGGLFAHDGTRPLDKGFAAHAWAADQRIGSMTGQIFSETYRNKILNGANQRLDSTQATLAHTAIMMTEPNQGPEALKLIQEARYIHGKDITQKDSLIALLKAAGYEKAADLLDHQSDALKRENRSRIEQGQILLAQVRSNGVPTLIAQKGEQVRPLPSSLLYGRSAQLQAALKAL
jgi:putative protein-disulfide isomerase